MTTPLRSPTGLIRPPPDFLFVRADVAIRLLDVVGKLQKPFVQQRVAS